jgi:D-alanyl-lipoteichoic acid acyltransferase DltB (MBOAT superfamily)
MNFYDYGFMFVFLPAVVAGARLTRSFGQVFQFVFLICASAIFYASWNTASPLLLAGSIIFNYALGRTLQRRPNNAALGLGVAVNLALLFYYKYFNFFIDSLGSFLDLPSFAQVALPLGISFFTFQQIAYLVDSNRREVGPHTFASYSLFISLFPHLIAGPIVLHSDVLKQLHRSDALKIDQQGLALGIAMFIVGLGKKIIVADAFAGYATPLFAKAAAGPLGVVEGWQAALAYTFQIYYDFSGYSDMAVGLGLCLGVRLPFNFDSPYKSRSLVEFWRRWHISLSRFLRYYLYIPLGGNKTGRYRTLLNIFIVMVLGGLWHGASWTFVAWGALHGAVLLINKSWPSLWPGGARYLSAAPALGWLSTFVVVVFAWVLFRSPDIATAWRIWQAMLGVAAAPGGSVAWPLWAMVIVATAACTVLPNSQQLVLLDQGTAATLPWWQRLAWRPGIPWGVGLGCVLAAAVIWTWQATSVPEFIYFNF